MKPTLHRYFGLLLLSLFLLGSSMTQAQLARKQPMFEHFTNAGCGPCALQNPYFQAVRLDHIGTVNHVAYHTSGPGSDPMYSANPTENNAMDAFYFIPGVPTMVTDGNFQSFPVEVTDLSIANSIYKGSPIRIRVEETAGTSRDVTVSVEGMSESPAGTYILRVLVVEDPKIYAFAPGTNGEKNFPNVFRQTIGGTAGIPVTMPAAGSTNTYNYNYTVSAAWDASKTYVIAYVQNTATKEILNSGSSRAPRFDLSFGESPIYQSGGTPTTFKGLLEEFGSGPENLTLTFTATQPAAADWTASFTVNGTTYTNSASLTINGGDIEEITVNTTSGSTAGIGEYTLEVSSTDNPDFAPQFIGFVVINNVTDLVVNTEEAFGEGSPPGSFITEPFYTEGLEAAGRISRGSIGHGLFLRAEAAGALDQVLNIYYNFGYSVNSASDDKVKAFTNFMDRGGNLFLSGQDLGWEIMDAGSPGGTTTSRNFFLNYLEADYNGDGSPSTTSLTFVAADPWMGGGGNSGITAIYGSAYVYPDEIGPNGPEATSIMYYNNNPLKSGGIRTEKNGYKVVYLGVGIEMFSDPEVAKYAVKLAHDYFWDGVSGLEFDALMASAFLGQNVPNPASGTTAVPLYDWNKAGTLRLSDLQGRLVREIAVQPGQNRVDIDLSGLEAGLYVYYLTDGSQQTGARKLTILP